MSCLIYAKQLEVPCRHDEKAVEEAVFRGRKEGIRVRRFSVSRSNVLQNRRAARLHSFPCILAYRGTR